MARPKSRRTLSDGTELPENLYPKTKYRLDQWLYKKPDGCFRSFTASVDEAIALATQANQVRGSHQPIAGKSKRAKSLDLDRLPHQAEQYFKWRATTDPDVVRETTWHQRQNYIREFSKDLSHVPLPKLTLQHLRKWWEPMGYHQQHARRPELNRFFNYLASEGVITIMSNPFSKYDSGPRCVKKKPSGIKRQRLDLDDYWTIYNKAGEMGFPGIQLAMAISMLTTMRLGDIVALRYDEHVVEGSLKKTIQKSEKQRQGRAARLEWVLAEHPALKEIVNRCRILSMKHYGCPYLISYKPKQKRVGSTKTHVAQMTADKLGKEYRKILDATGLWLHLDQEDATHPTFHEIRALASERMKSAGHSRDQVKELMAHTDERVTEKYQSGHDYSKISIQLTADHIGGQF